MELAKASSILFFCFFFTYALSVRAHIAEFDEVWQQRAKEAEERTINHYEPNPVKVTNHVNLHVHKALQKAKAAAVAASKNTKSGPCLATNMNPIDRCWRCDAKWAETRQNYAKCVLGFGRKSIGGKEGRIYTVTDPSDDDMVNPKNGTLRHAVIQKEPLWIIFNGDMNIKLKQELIVTSLKTIDGRGANVHIANGAGITIQFVHDVIITNIHIHDTQPTAGGLIRDSVDHFGQRGRSDGDAVSIFGSSNIWIDHLSLARGKDGLIDAIQGSTAITLSNNFFTEHDKTILLGASDSYEGDKKMQVTVAFNHFGEKLVQRLPMARWGFVHVLNNDYTKWEMYAIGGNTHPTIISQGNRFVAPDNKNAKQVTHRNGATENEWKKCVMTSEGDVLENGAIFKPSGSPFDLKKLSNLDIITPKPGTAVPELTRSAGVLTCKVGAPC